MKRILIVIFIVVFYTNNYAQSNTNMESITPENLTDKQMENMYKNAERMLKDIRDTLNQTLNLMKEAQKSKEMQKLLQLNNIMKTLNQLIKQANESYIDLKSAYISKDKKKFLDAYARIKAGYETNKQIKTQLAVITGLTEEGLEGKTEVKEKIDTDLNKIDTIGYNDTLNETYFENPPVWNPSTEGALDGICTSPLSPEDFVVCQ